jgi:methionyl-tRNA formyltransferase
MEKEELGVAATIELPFVFLFCNHIFGLPFAKTILRSLDGNAHVVLINSEKFVKDRHHNPVKEYWTRFKFFLLKVSVRLLGLAHGAVVRSVEDINHPDFLRTIPAGAHGIIAGFNQIFHHEAIASFKSLVNFHGSVLPLYRGPTPSFWVLRNKERRTGYTMHQVTERVDCGDILFQDIVPCKGARSAEDLNRRIARQAQRVFARYLDQILAGEEWEPVQLDAFSIYNVHLSYARSPTDHSALSRNPMKYFDPATGSRAASADLQRN